jgi:ribosomal protein S10
VYKSYYKIKIKTPDKQIFSFFRDLFGKNQVFKTVTLPKSIKRFAFIKSPHINSSSKEHFQIILYQRLFFLNVDLPTLITILPKISNVAVVNVVKHSTQS